ncbi:terminase small subunit [Sediminimonas sp.]|uniref:terminase small subunit n=1 Tax=Sediminimonas sp. TaxID=2823379 RepID=UPI0025DC49F3|nr:terminase small subunit [Sediminimonas sp.]
MSGRKKVDDKQRDIGAPRSIDERIEDLMQHLPPKKQLLVRHYLICRNGAEAYRRAGYRCQPQYARHEASRAMRTPVIQEIVRLDEQRIAEKLNITHEDIARRWWQIATANVADVVALHTPPCRYCYGEGHEFQWRTQREFRDAFEAAKAKILAGLDAKQANAMAEKIDAGEIIDPLMPDDAGGYGYSADLPPHPDCPECDGRGGAPTMQITDTDDMSDQARLLYDGVKQTQHGIEILMQDRGKALENLAKHIGMFREQDDDDAINPLQRLAARIMSGAQTVPVVPDEELPGRTVGAIPADKMEDDHDDVDP